LLDFGIARIIDDDAAMVTTAALMTPDYAAPEQLDNAHPTVATDVYALGAVLFELVAGRGPWRDAGASLPSIIRRVLNDDPPLPSRLAASGTMPFPASAVAGDIDAIVMKAMRRNPLDRYRSVTELADDIRRHLELKPVRARAGSTGYAMGRFVRRYRIAVGAAAAALAALLIGAGGIAWQARQTAIERDVALAEARRSEAINRMLTVMFRDTGDSKAGADATVKQMLDQTAMRLVESLDTSPRSATLITTLADLYVNLEDAAGEDALLRQALAKGIGKGDPVSTAQIKMRLASSAAALNKTDDMAPLLDAADAVFRTDPERFRTERLEVVSARAQLARRQGDYDTAIRLLTDNMAEAERVYAENHRDLLTLYNNLLVYLIEANRLDAMPAITTRAEAAVIRTGQQQTVSGLQIFQFRGLYHVKRGEYVAAEHVLDGVVATRRKLFGKSAGMAVDLLQLSRVKIALGKYAEGLRLLSEARPLAEQYLGPSAVPTLVIDMGLAEAMVETGNTAGADRVLAEVAPLVTAIAPRGVPHAILARTRAITLLKQDRPAEARVELDRAEAILKGLGPAGETYLKGLLPLRARIAKAS
jgi:non-specific serine/threonine protein kinase/serine/threonine-protein kinase